MILSIRNRYLRGVAVWALILAGVVAFPFVVIIGAAIDGWNNLKTGWREAKEDRRICWRLMTFRSVE